MILILLFCLLTFFVGTEGQTICRWEGGPLLDDVILEIKEEGCNIIDGNVFVGLSVENLTGLINITTITGYFQCANNPEIKSLNGLDNLVEVGGYMSVQNCDQLQSIDALSSLRYIKEHLYLLDLPLVENIGNLALEDIGGLALRIPKIKILSNSFSKVRILNATTQPILLIDQNTALESLDGLNIVFVADFLTVSSNPLLKNIDSLISVKTVGGFVRYNSGLKNIYGLSNIQSFQNSRNSKIDFNPMLDCASFCNQKILFNLQNMGLTTDCSIQSQIFDICNSNNYTNSINETLCGFKKCLYCTDFNCTVGTIEGDIPYCGDEILQIDEGEECDQNITGSFNCNYNQLNCSFCNLQCKIEQGNVSYCGDGIVQTGEGEECDQNITGSFDCNYNQLNCSFCNLQCKLEQGNVSYCGDGIVQIEEGEECDNLFLSCENCKNVPETTSRTTSNSNVSFTLISNVSSTFSSSVESQNSTESKTTTKSDNSTKSMSSSSSKTTVSTEELSVSNTIQRNLFVPVFIIFVILG